MPLVSCERADLSTPTGFSRGVRAPFLFWGSTAARTLNGADSRRERAGAWLRPNRYLAKSNCESVRLKLARGLLLAERFDIEKLFFLSRILFGCAEHLGAVVWGGFRLARAQMHAELHASEGELVPGKQSTASHALTVDARAVRAAQIANEEQAIGLGDGTVQLRDAGVIKNYVAQATFAANDGHFPGN